MAIPNVGPLRYSLFAESILKTIHQVDRAILSRATSPTEEDKILPSEQIQSMVAQAKAALSQPQTLINQLSTILVDLYAEEVFSGQICTLFDQMDKDFVDSLCHLGETVEGSAQGDSKYEKHRIRENPRLLLTIVNLEGENPIEILIKNQGVSLKDFKQILSSTRFHIQEQISAQIVNKKMFIESYYQQLAKEIADPNKSLDLNLITGDENLAFEVAKIVAAQSGWKISLYIEEYGIKNTDHLFTIAKIAAAQSGWGVSMYIENYKIQNTDHLFVIAKIAAAQDGRRVSAYIENYKIQNTDHLFTIAKIAAAQNGWGVSAYIKDYKIQNKDHLFTIAKIAAAQDGFGLTDCIKDYGIEDKDHLFIIAQVAAAQDGVNMFKSFANYSLTDSKVIICRCLCVLDMLIKNNLLPQFVGFFEAAWQKFQEIEEFKTIDAGIKKIQQSITEMEIQYGKEKAFEIEAFQYANAELDRLGKIRLRRLTLYQFKEVFFADKGKAIPEDLEKTFKLVREYRNAALAGSLTRLLCEEQSSNASYVECHKLLFGDKNYLRLPMIFLAKWAPDLDQSKAISFLLSSIPEPLNNEVTGVLQTWLQTLLAMDQSPLSSNRKCALIAQVFQSLKTSDSALSKALQKKLSQELCKRLRFIQTLCLSGQARYLEREFSSEMIQELKSIFLDKLKEDCFIDLKGIDKLADKYLKTLDTLRQPLAWKVYEENIQTLKDSLVQEQFQRFIVSILEGTFLTERYRIDLSPHLKCLHEKCPEILVKWKAPQVSIVINPSQMEPSESRPIDFPAFFKEKHGNKHFQIDGKDQFPIFTDFLEKTPDNQKKALADLKKRLRTASKEEAPDHTIEFLMELYLIKKGSPLPLLRKLNRELQKIPALELANDINGLIKDLEVPSVKSTLKVIDTDDWQDLFLSGTEVEGSCQRVDGDPFFNKCLLAYVMDGKNRMLAVKDSSGKIVARSIFRLLWDDTNQKPLLFQDAIYPWPCRKDLVSALNQHAEKRAKELDCLLVTRNFDREEMSDYPGTAVSLGSSCPYEYADALRSLIIKGKFKIDRLKQVKLS